MYSHWASSSSCLAIVVKYVHRGYDYHKNHYIKGQTTKVRVA